MVASPVNPSLVGGRYRIDGSIASGGMAEVWRATDMHLKRQVAVKMLKPKVADDEVTAERFRREARALAKLSHPNIVPVYDCVEDGKQVALVMELIEGKSLRELLDDAAQDGQRAGTLSVHLTVRIGVAIALALAKSHETNIIHRDIKPGNILITSDGRVLLADFGIAKPLKASDDDPTDLTKADIMMGTAKYLSPEQVQGRPMDGRADIYSLGLVLYECLAGDAPFREANDQATAIARLQRDPTPLHGLRPDVPSTVVAVIDKMLRRKPEHRHADCHEVAKALDDAIRHTHDAITPVAGVDVSPRPTKKTTDVGDPLMPKKPSRLREQLATEIDRGVPEPRPAPTLRDKTPKGIPQAKESLPKSQKTNMTRSYSVIAALLLVAVVMSVMLWRGMQGTRSDVVAPGGDPVYAPVNLVGLRSFDPLGDDRQENESMLGALTDNNPATSWTTVCYGNRYFGSKGGVGVIAELSGVGIGTLSATFANGPWSAEMYVAAGDAPPTSLDAWGPRVGDNFGKDPGKVDFEMRAPGRWALLFLTEAGRHPTCSNNNPFKAELHSLSFTSAP